MSLWGSGAKPYSPPPAMSLSACSSALLGAALKYSSLNFRKVSVLCAPCLIPCSDRGITFFPWMLNGFWLSLYP